MTMLAYHNDPAVKEHYMARVRASREADDIVRGSYGHSVNSHWRGCAVGCTLHTDSASHDRYETELGIPRILARLEDSLFEALPYPDYLDWPLNFLAAVPVGADLSLVWPRFAIWMLADPADGVIRFAKNKSTRKAIQNVADLYARVVAGENVDANTWWDARKAAAAYAAAAGAADGGGAYAAAAYAYAAAAYAADAADAAAYAYADAADAAAAAVAAAVAAYAAAYAADAADAAVDARTSMRVKQAAKLIELMASAPVMVPA